LTDGGKTWSSRTIVSDLQVHDVSLSRGFRLPGSTISNAGTVYTFWQDCRFEQGCSANDLVMSTSQDGLTWTPPARLPLDAVGSGVDHFIPGPAADSSEITSRRRSPRTGL